MKVLIVGAGLGALRTAESLRTHNYSDEITIVGEEPYFPYNRPPLSKSSLSEKLDHAQLEFKRSENIADANWIFSDPAVSVDMQSQHIVLESGRHENFDYLVAATGIRPRHLAIPGSEKEIFTLRNLDHSSALFAEISKSKKIIIIGAGFIGCEMAATVRSQGIEVVVVAADPEPMFVPLGKKLGAAMRERHELHGVTFSMNVTIQSFIGDHRARGVSFANGLEINGDLVLEAVGSVPNTEWLQGTDIDLSNGVLVDGNMRAESKGNMPIFAVGDVARYRFDLFDKEPHRIEHWNLPTESGRRAGESIARLCAGLPLLNPPVEFIPAFWSDQYEYRIQSFGMPHLADRSEIVAGEMNGPCVVEYLRGDEIVGVIGIDSEAGPTEIAILADETAIAADVAADLISQAEHDPIAAAVLVTDSLKLADAVVRELEIRVSQTKHSERIYQALQGVQSAIALVDSIEQGLDVVNAYAAEHLEIHTANARADAAKIRNAGAVFIGRFSPVSLGDYAAGSNHVLPTGGCACHSSGLSVQTFLRGLHFIEYGQNAFIDIMPTVITLANSEDLPAHGAAMTARLENLS